MRSPFKNKKLLIGSIAGLAAVAAVSTIAIAGPPFGVPGQQKNIDPVYGVCRGTDPSCYNDLVGERANAVLVYSRTADPNSAVARRTYTWGRRGAMGTSSTVHCSIFTATCRPRARSRCGPMNPPIASITPST